MSRSTGMCESDQARKGMHAFAAKAAPTGRSYRPLLHGELLELRSLLSTANHSQYRCDDAAADSSTDEFKQ